MKESNHVFENLPDDIKKYFNHCYDRYNETFDDVDIKYPNGWWKEEYSFLRQSNNKLRLNLTCGSLCKEKSIVYVPIQNGVIRKTGETHKFGDRRKSNIDYWDYVYDDKYYMLFLDEWVGKEICVIPVPDTSVHTRRAFESFFQGKFMEVFKSINPNENYG